MPKDILLFEKLQKEVCVLYQGSVSTLNTVSYIVGHYKLHVLLGRLIVYHQMGNLPNSGPITSEDQLCLYLLQCT